MGREDHLEALQGYLGEAFQGRGNLVMIGGEAGIGKTRLAEEFEKLARSVGARTVQGRCIPGAPYPYHPFVEAFDKAEKECFPSIHPPRYYREEIERVDRSGYRKDNDHYMLEVLEYLRCLAKNAPMVIRIEDLHWADSASIQMMHFLARNLDGINCLIIGTYRPEDVGFDDSGKSPLLEALRTMRREDTVRELHLARLNDQELAMVLQGMLGGLVRENLFLNIMKESQGNPLFAIETLRWLVTTESITPQMDGWDIIDGVNVVIPNTIREVIIARLERITPEERRILEGAATIGEAFDPILLSDMLSMEHLQLLERLDQIESKSMLIVAVDNGYRFGHEMIKRVVYEDISAPRRSMMHLMIARIQERQLPKESILGSLSFHFKNGGDTESCLKYSILAGKSSMAGWALVEARQYFQTALEICREMKLTDERYLVAAEGFADASKGYGLFEVAVVNYQNCLAHIKEPCHRASLLRRMGECYLPHGGNDIPMARQYLEQAERVPEITPIELGRIKGIQGRLQFYIGEKELSRRLMEEAEALLIEHQDDESYGLLLLDHSRLLYNLGLSESVKGKAISALALFQRNHDYVNEAAACQILAELYLIKGNVNECYRMYSQCLDISDKFGFNILRVFCHLYRSKLLLYHCDDNEGAYQDSVKALDVARTMESNYLLAVALVNRGTCEIESGRTNEALLTWREVEQMKSAIPSSIKSPAHGYYLMLSGMVLEKNDRWEESKSYFENSIKFFKDAMFWSIWVPIVCIVYARTLDAHGEKSRELEVLHLALDIYQGAGNDHQVRRIEKWITDIG